MLYRYGQILSQEVSGPTSLCASTVTVHCYQNIGARFSGPFTHGLKSGVTTMLMDGMDYRPRCLSPTTNPATDNSHKVAAALSALGANFID